MATGTLTGSTIASTYKSILKVKGGANTILDGDIQLIEDGDGVDSVLGLATDSALINGDGSRLYFYDADGDEHISADTSGVLSIAAGAEIDLTATAVDLNGTLDVSGNTQLSGTVTVSADGTGKDVIFYSGTAGDNFTWDASEECLIITGTDAAQSLKVADGDLVVVDKIYLYDNDGGEYIHGSSDGHLEVNSGTTLDITAPTVDINASTAVTVDGPAVTIADDTGSKPLIIVKNTANDTTGSELRFVMDKGSAGADGDDLGTISFYGDDAGQNQTAFAKIVAEVSEADETDEAGKLSFYVAESDGTNTALTAGLVLEGEHATDGEIDVTIGAGASSTTTVAGDLSVAGDVIMADGKGIDFAADASPSAGMTAEILDDYEEGTWDAVVTDGTNPMTMNGSCDTGYYTKVGNLVTVSGLFITTSLGDPAASGAIRITGLPFTVANNNAAYSGGGATYGEGLDLAAAGHTIGYYGATNNTFIVINVWDATAGISGMLASEWTADGGIMIGFTYRAA